MLNKQQEVLRRSKRKCIHEYIHEGNTGECRRHSMCGAVSGKILPEDEIQVEVQVLSRKKKGWEPGEQGGELG